jgi:hypothetical protein
MRLHRGVPMIAAFITMAGPCVPAALGFERAGAPTASGQPTALVEHHSGDSSEWAIGFGAAGGLAVSATGLTVIRSRARKRQHAAVRVS